MDGLFICSHVLYGCPFFCNIYVFIYHGGWLSMDGWICLWIWIFCFSSNQGSVCIQQMTEFASSPSLHLRHLPRVHCFISEGQFEELHTFNTWINDLIITTSHKKRIKYFPHHVSNINLNSQSPIQSFSWCCQGAHGPSLNTLPGCSLTHNVFIYVKCGL